MNKKIINIDSFGNFWLNREAVHQALLSVSSEDLVLFYCLEGISFEFSGLLDFIKTWQNTTGHPTEQIQVWCMNRKELIPYPNVCEHENKIWGLHEYKWWQTPAEFVDQPQYLFGLFVGRDTFSRSLIMYECYQTWQTYFLFSRMKRREDTSRILPAVWESNSDRLDCYLSVSEHEKFKEFWMNHPFKPLDQQIFGEHMIADASIHAAVSLLQFYDQFGVELVLETMTRGTTFFPTEKTVRPMVGMKPFLTYAPKNYLRYLRDMGFKTFGDVWDENYDNFEGIDRWQQMKKVVQYIIDNPMVISQTKPIVEYNKNLLITRKFSKDAHATPSPDCIRKHQ